MEKVLNYSRGIVAQEKAWDCGPASAQIILNSCGIDRSEDWLIGRIGTTEAGTNHSGLITPILNELLPGSGYKVIWLPKDPPTQNQTDALWQNVTRSIDANRGCIANFVAPPWNFPKPSYTSTDRLNYTGTSTIFHYVALMGVATDNGNGRHVWIADPGFRPHGMWCRVEDVARLITPHSYAYAADAPAVETPPPAPAPNPAPAPAPPTQTAEMWVEWNAYLGDQSSIAFIVKAAQTDSRAKLVLAAIERNNPDALQQFISTRG